MYLVNPLFNWAGLRGLALGSICAGIGSGIVLFLSTAYGIRHFLQFVLDIILGRLPFYWKENTAQEMAATVTACMLEKRPWYGGLSLAVSMLLCGPFFTWSGLPGLNFGGPDGHPLSGVAMFLVTAYGITHILRGITELTIGKLCPRWIYLIPKDETPPP